MLHPAARSQAADRARTARPARHEGSRTPTQRTPASRLDRPGLQGWISDQVEVSTFDAARERPPRIRAEDQLRPIRVLRVPHRDRRP